MDTSLSVGAQQSERAKTCPRCGASYTTRLKFCTRDGETLVALRQGRPPSADSGLVPLGPEDSSEFAAEPTTRVGSTNWTEFVSPDNRATPIKTIEEYAEALPAAIREAVLRGAKNQQRPAQTPPPPPAPRYESLDLPVPSEVACDDAHDLATAIVRHSHREGRFCGRWLRLPSSLRSGWLVAVAAAMAVLLVYLVTRNAREPVAPGGDPSRAATASPALPQVAKQPEAPMVTQSERTSVVAGRNPGEKAKAVGRREAVTLAPRLADVTPTRAVPVEDQGASAGQDTQAQAPRPRSTPNRRRRRRRPDPSANQSPAADRKALHQTIDPFED